MSYPTTIPEIRKAGMDALLDRLGPAGTIRFMQEFDPGYGDYTEERHLWMDGQTVEEIMARIRKRQSGAADNAEYT